MRLFRWVFGLHFVCLILLFAAQPPELPMIALAACIGASWFWVRRHPALGFGPRAVEQLIAHPDGSWTVQRANGAQFDGTLASDAVVRGPCLVLRFRLADGGAVTRLIGGDELPPESLRRLRARLAGQD